jgi:hypothetical protein
MGRAVLLWSDGTVAAYDDLNITGEAAYSRKLKGFANLDSNKSSNSSSNAKESSKTPGGKKKRALPSSANGAGSGRLAGPAALVDAGDGVVIVAGWSSTSSGGSSSLRFVAIDAIFGAIQCAANIDGGDVQGAMTAAKLDSKNSIQVGFLFLSLSSSDTISQGRRERGS